jgi:hypothetical protein
MNLDVKIDNSNMITEVKRLLVVVELSLVVEGSLRVTQEIDVV